jgi:hypothetical protein
MTKLYLTYDNEAMRDGAGAQLQRIFGIYSIAKKLKISYVHSGIIETIEERAHNAKSEHDLQNLIEDLNANFSFPSSQLPAHYQEVKIHQLTFRKLIKLYLRKLVKRENLLVKICLPFGIIDKVPDWYEVAGKYVRENNPRFSGTPKQVVVIHIRYGYQPLVGLNKGSSPRFLPLHYYPRALESLIARNNLSSDFPFLIQTDLPENSGLWKPFQVKRLNELREIGYKESNNEFEYQTVDLKKALFSRYPNLRVRYCAPILECLEDMVNAKYLMVSRSSFSYIAAVINPNTVTFPRSHGHSKLGRWQWDFTENDVPKFDLLSGI